MLLLVGVLAVDVLTHNARFGRSDPNRSRRTIPSLVSSVQADPILSTENGGAVSTTDYFGLLDLTLSVRPTEAGIATGHGIPRFPRISFIAGNGPSSDIFVSPVSDSDVPSNPSLTARLRTIRTGLPDTDEPADAFPPESVEPVPEPSTLLLLGSGVVGLVVVGLRPRRWSISA